MSLLFNLHFNLRLLFKIDRPLIRALDKFSATLSPLSLSLLDHIVFPVTAGAAVNRLRRTFESADVLRLVIN